ncbi:Hsp20/alpha crystallin family protein [Aquisediminimonas profunda]|uniref:Hsp20/alpha crystallin family protein n=1 Tax=Aquisediminimonas profunda TaxID=1550733 RepID=UPI001FE581F0|nr:Hsp20/alpha crystallin family protein [Aquisediminimonas profunda]
MNDATKAVAKPTTAARMPAFDVGPVGWLRSEIDRLFEDFGRPSRSAFNFAMPKAMPVPALEMADDGKAYKLTAELPGLTEKDVEISIADGVLSITGEKKEETERKEEGYLLSERRYGSFSRQVALPQDADEGAISAKFKNGILSIAIGKNEAAKPQSRKIAIEA